MKPNTRRGGHNKGCGNLPDLVLSRLKGVKQTAANKWIACCPAHPDEHPSLGISVGDDGKVLLICRSQGCSAEQICKAVGLTLSDLFPSQKGKLMKRIVATYDYVDADGKPLFQAVRYDPKDFLLRQPDGKGGWIWDIKGVERVLYRLPQVRKAVADGQTVFVVEGEKDADNLAKLGLVATTNPGGADTS